MVVYTIVYDHASNKVNRFEVNNRGNVDWGAKLSDLQDVALAILAAKSDHRQTYFVIEVPSDWVGSECEVPVKLSATERLLSSARGLISNNYNHTKKEWEEYLADKPKVGTPNLRKRYAELAAKRRAERDA